MREDLRSYTECRTGLENRLCFICVTTPCCCSLRRIEERRGEILARMEEEKRDCALTQDELNRSVFHSYNLTQCQEEEQASKEEDQVHQDPLEDKASKKRKRNEEDSPKGKASKLGKKWLQHQPLAHQGGAGAKEEDQQLH